MSHHPHAAAQRLTLHPDEIRLLQLRSGDQLFAAQGRLQLTEPPQAMDDEGWRLRRALRCGEGHAVTRDGWVRLEAGEAPVQVRIDAAGRQRSHPHRHQPHHTDTLPACDPRALPSPRALAAWRLLERLGQALANSARQRQRMPS